MVLGRRLYVEIFLKVTMLSLKIGGVSMNALETEHRLIAVTGRIPQSINEIHVAPYFIVFLNKNPEYKRNLALDELSFILI